MVRLLNDLLVICRLCSLASVSLSRTRSITSSRSCQRPASLPDRTQRLPLLVTSRSASSI